MKKNNVFVSIVFLLIVLSCSREFERNVEMEPCKGQKELLAYFESKLSRSQTTLNVSNFVNESEELMMNYIETGHSGLCGNYFIIPVRNKTNGVIESSLVYPVINENAKEYSFAGGLAEPFMLNLAMLNEIPEEYRFLFSYRFLQWENEGLDVLPSLTAYALKLYNCYVPFGDMPSSPILTTRSLPPGCCTVRYVVDYLIYANGYMDDGEIYVLQISSSTLERAFFDATGSLNSFKEYCGGVFIRNISPLVMDVQFKSEAVIPIVIKSYMGAVESYLWSSAYACKIDYQYSAYVYPTWDNIPGGNISEGGTGAGSTGGTSSNFPVVDAESLAQEGYINSVYERLNEYSDIFSRLLRKFQKENSIAHLKWELSMKLDDREAGFLQDSLDNYWFTIFLNQKQLVKFPPLCIAKTMVHELMHADIYMKLLSLKECNFATLSSKELQDLQTALDRQNFPILAYYYSKYKYSATSHHQYMSVYQVETIASALHEIDPGTSMEICTAIAWQGLKTVITIENGKYKEIISEGWVQLSEDERNRVDLLYKNYITTTPPSPLD